MGFLLRVCPYMSCDYQEAESQAKVESELERLRLDMGKGKAVKLEEKKPQEVKPHPPQVHLGVGHEEDSEDSDDLPDNGGRCGLQLYTLLCDIIHFLIVCTGRLTVM